MATGCGSSDTSTAPSTSSADTTVAESSTTEPALDGAGLALRILGTVTRSDGANDNLLCPGDRRPCIPFTGAIDAEAGERVWVVGRLLDGVFEVDDQRTPPPDFIPRDYSNQCPDQDIEGAPSEEVLIALYEDESQRPEGFADLWDSDDGVLHLGVAGGSAPAESFLEERGVADQVCLVPGFPHPDAVLETVQSAVTQAGLASGFENLSSSRDSWQGTVTLFIPASDQALRADLDAISAANDDVVIEVVAGVEVVNGSLADYEAALAEAEVNPDPAEQLTATCWAVRFSSVPPDLDEFPPLDEDARAALDGLINGPTGVEAQGFDSGTEWSIASRTDTELILFGRQAGAGDQPELLNAQFMQTGDGWAPSGWGGCTIAIEAPGLGPATVATDPDNPPTADATEVRLLIQERSCANGQAPVDREVLTVVDETSDAVTVVALVAPVEGGANCPSNPWHPITVMLDRPLADRQLVDGQHYPAQPMESADDLG